MALDAPRTMCTNTAGKVSNFTAFQSKTGDCFWLMILNSNYSKLWLPVEPCTLSICKPAPL